MGVATFVHHVGTLLLLVATGLLIVVDVTAPVVNSLAIMRVGVGSQGQGSEVTFGTFGYLHRGGHSVRLLGEGQGVETTKNTSILTVCDIRNGDQCSRARIGYNPAEIMSQIDGTSFGSATETTAKGLTRVMVLHPIATGLCFIAFLLCLGTSVAGSLLAAFISLLAFVFTAVATVCDFVAFSLIRRDVNQNGRSQAGWSSGICCVLAAAFLSLVAAALVLVTCCAGRSKKRRAVPAKGAYNDEGLASRRRFWNRR